MIRALAPSGEIGEIPEEELEAALAEGFRVMPDSEMAALYNRQEIERRWFEQQWKKKNKAIRIPRIRLRGR